MSDRRKYEGEEDLQLQLLEVTEDPMFGKHTSQHKGVLAARDKMEIERAGDVAERCVVKVLH